MRKVAVFFGGKSCENEISVLTGVFVARLLQGDRYDVLPVYIHTDGRAYTSPKMRDLNVFKTRRTDDFLRLVFMDGVAYSFACEKKKLKRIARIDAAINCCHGGLGEGGGVSALCEWNGVPLASPDLTASGVFMDKYLTKVVMKGLGIPVLEYIRVNERDYEKRGAFLLKTIETRLKFPVVIKPAHLGSSIGIMLAKNEDEAKTAIESAFHLDDRVIIERYLENKRDVNCAAYMLEGEIVVSEPEEAFGEGIYSFEEKYVKRQTDGGNRRGGRSTKDGGRYALSKEIRDKIRAYTKTVYKRMDLRGAVRLDFLIADGEIYLCEVNTVPGSLAYYLFCERVTDARDFFSDLIEEAVRGVGQGKKILSTGILQNVQWQGK